MTQPQPDAPRDAESVIAATESAANRRYAWIAIGSFFLFVISRALFGYLPYVPPERRSIWDPREFVGDLMLGAIAGMLFPLYQWVGDSRRRRATTWFLALIIAFVCLAMLRALPAAAWPFARSGLGVRDLLAFGLATSVPTLVFFPLGWAYELADERFSRSLVRFPTRGAPSAKRRG